MAEGSTYIVFFQWSARHIVGASLTFTACVTGWNSPEHVDIIPNAPHTLESQVSESLRHNPRCTTNLLESENVSDIIPCAPHTLESQVSESLRHNPMCMLVHVAPGALSLSQWPSFSLSYELLLTPESGELHVQQNMLTILHLNKYL